jgi:hypothetical protein
MPNETTNEPVHDPVKARREAFELEQKARAEAFEREQAANAQRQERIEQEAAHNAEVAKAIAEARAKNDEAALNDGFITHDDLLNRSTMLASYHGVLLPHETVVPDEATVKMAFPRNVVLTHSASDVKRLNPDVPLIDSPIQHGSRVLFYKGYHDVPLTLADHQYLADSGAYRLGSDGKPEAPEARAERVKAAKEERKAEPKVERVRTDAV